MLDVTVRPDWAHSGFSAGCVTCTMSECMCVPVQNDSGHSLGGGDPLTKFKRQMSLTTKGCITPSGMEEQLRLSGARTHTPDLHAVLPTATWCTV